MSLDRWSPFLDIPAFPGNRYAVIADRLAALMNTRNDLVMVQAEAVVALEAAATSIMRPGVKAINIVTSPYGQWFGEWMRRAGGEVIDVTAMAARAIGIDAVAAAMAAHPDASVLSLVHAESASGICNPLADIMAMARAHGLITIVDAVASVGGHDLDVDTLGIDIAVIGPQKALAGPAGLSALSISPAAWERIEKPQGPVNSILSLSDLKLWIDNGRGPLAGTTVNLEWHALDAALDRVEAEGMDAVIARHTLAAKATRAGLAALGAPAWAAADTASNLVTAVEVPDGLSPETLITSVAHLGQPLATGVGPGAEKLVRLTHTGQLARFDVVLGAVSAYGMALIMAGHKVDLGAASSAIADCYAESRG
ncbi:aminotransferase class V-fold PLP-dependent enzyme [Neorhizobium sp. JUb45]|uniref:pyridoxal-phosphate-dependent aminotransferase family protein n=1 Tax=unclassified Neorhizobium TaxID=2629175 RepID=UPI001044FDF7|nr:aminotransferase class V-fold PLP-dependent enzyme [Neorhizobium sp. JUb45]TCR07106.1 aspartate aminotransferase-like enzyme [Neorhizobium sp. JUb45]